VQSRLLLDVVVAQSTAILKLLAGEDETLLVRRNAFLVYCMLDGERATTDNSTLTLDLALHIVNRVRRLNLKGYGFARKGLNVISMWMI
jgi:hypothetical protein